MEYFIDTLNNLADSRVASWPLLTSPLPVIGIVTAYLLIVYKLGPRYMENKQPYDLKYVMGVYNLFQVLACAYIIHGILSTEMVTLKFWQCHPVDYRGDQPKAMALLRLTYTTFLLKIVELIETVFFVMRKKYNQISQLHVYHHASTVTMSYLMVKYVGGGMILFSVVLNSCVHIIMYSYYFAALFGPNFQKKLEPIKKRITMFQMVQFTLILMQCVIGIFNQCDVPKFLLAVYMPNVALIFYMFYNFFNASYTKSQAKLGKESD